MNDKKEKIKRIFASISSKHKNNVRKTLSDQFNVTVDSVKINWIYGGKIPENYIDEVLEILEREAKMQHSEILKLIDFK
ncbi:hypothetical protein [Chryseobacterium fistulae]|uniref:Uncharacterized protein n=1 Tax=Chryseobacterium fistulae TaxID=2675058 RepID=A0A6N4XVQ2_9FLAO|nr:hypothetical protein [Chryseobacterium fistulae]CAA7389524.1 hypothetical protein CHRY9393_02169 [Chryseobacterium fistulae]